MEPIVVTRIFKLRESVGITWVLAPSNASNAVYELPPPRPTEEYKKATAEKIIAAAKIGMMSSFTFIHSPTIGHLLPVSGI